MKRYILIYYSLICLFSSLVWTPLSAQDGKLINLSGVIVGVDGLPVQGASITAGEGNIHTYSDAAGMFAIETEVSGMLRIDAPGYEPLLIAASDVDSGVPLQLERPAFHMGTADQVNVAFGKLSRRQIVGAVGVVNPDEVLPYDNQQDVLSVLQGRIPGLFGTKGIRGQQNPLIVVDGIPRSSGMDDSPFNFIEDLQLDEVAQITVLKDALSCMLYGAQADQGVVLITTKRGTPFKRDLKVHSQFGIKSPISYPEFLGAADYMTAYNQALVNDGLAPQYTSETIEQTRLGTDWVRYPDESFYNSTYLNDFSTYHRVATEASGGNEKARYYSFAGWTRNNSLFALGEGKNAGLNQFNFRGNVDYHLNDWISASLDAVVILSADRNPNGTSFWSAAASHLPNSYPMLIPISQINDEELIKSAKIIDNAYVLGGTNQYRNNIYGNFILGGYKILQQRTGQFNSGLNFKLDQWVKGLSASARLTYDMLNEYQISYNNQYAVYETGYDAENNLLLTKYGNDQRTNSQSLSNAASERRLGVYATLDYARVFADKHTLTANALGYWRNTKVMEEFFSDKSNHFGIRANYMYQNRYVAEFSGAYIGSGRLSPDNRYEFAPSFGVGWIISEESFLSGSPLVNYLKVKASMGTTKTDLNFPGYYLYSSTYNTGGSFNYNQRSGNSNKVRLFQNLGNPNLGLISREEVNLGFEAQLIHKKVWLEMNYFNSTSRGNLVKKSSVAPDYLGGLLAWENYENFNDQGVEWALSVRDQKGSFSYELGVNMAYVVPKTLRVNELYDENAPYLLRKNKPYDAIFGYVAQGLFRDSAEIMAHPQQTFGPVRPGDVRYIDLNADGIIDENDRKEIGNSRSRVQYAAQLTLRYKNMSLFALGTGQTGAEKTFSDSYYWISGNDTKYSKYALESWTPDRLDAKYPRLTTGSGSNNFRTSTFWLEKNNWFTIHTVQLGYHYQPSPDSFVKGLNFFVRGYNLATFSKIKDKLELNIGSAPQMRSYSIGVDLMF